MKEFFSRIKTVSSLGLNILIVILAAFGVGGMMTGTVSDGTALLTAQGTGVFKYFTVDSNLLMGLSALVSAVYLFAVLLGKRETVPKWAEVFRLTAVSAVVLTALVVAVYLAPEAEEGFSSMYMGANLLLHCVIPLLSVAELMLRRSGQQIRFRANFISLLPVVVYGSYYLWPYITAGADKTGYDWYGFLKNSTPESIVLLVLLVLMISLSVSVILWIATRNFDRFSLLASGRHEPRKDPSTELVSAIEFYQTRVIKLICVIAPAVALCAGIVFTTLTLTGRFGMSVLSLVFFDTVCLGYLPVALYIADTCIAGNGLADPTKVKLTKRLLTGLIILQWNLISYLAPFPAYWAYAFVFAAVSALFLDRKMLLINEALLLVSMILSWFVQGDILLPVRGENFVSDIIFRLTAVLLSFLLLYVLVLLVEKILLTSLDQISDFDPLTHTLTRRKLLRAVESALDTYNRIWVPCCVAIFDLDDFKRINDTYGHITGDEVLKEFARIMYANIQSRDIIFRYGGEEFLILFFCTDNYAEASCERILYELGSKQFSFLPAGEHITCTAGIAVSARDMTAEEFIALADKRLYAGKRAGKNRIVAE